ncbi:uncharacterized protein LOC112347823 [Selaginella moellendorffii]|uniref:uncharacterized protein LOC112347823 n=1 Tax=Selaginella moellendorffii TaxID=88036 RepID=UPI000D1C41F2|nr:uncharacterized protein LOC112347823 [Selaginella moellendorffii]|eukprot:XP_024535073.1 uncharacterized protein LOC112347823 [Selaginella moellendorffii]
MDGYRIRGSSFSVDLPELTDYADFIAERNRGLLGQELVQSGQVEVGRGRRWSLVGRDDNSGEGKVARVSIQQDEPSTTGSFTTLRILELGSRHRSSRTRRAARHRDEVLRPNQQDECCEQAGFCRQDCATISMDVIRERLDYRSVLSLSHDIRILMVLGNSAAEALQMSAL